MLIWKHSSSSTKYETRNRSKQRQQKTYKMYIRKKCAKKYERRKRRYNEINKMRPSYLMIMIIILLFAYVRIMCERSPCWSYACITADRPVKFHVDQFYQQPKLRFLRCRNGYRYSVVDTLFTKSMHSQSISPRVYVDWFGEGANSRNSWYLF